MEGNVTWERLRGLARFRAENGCAVSLYLNLDPSEVPTARDAQMRMNALLAEAEKRDPSDLTHHQRQGLKSDFERLARWFDDDFSRDGSLGLAIFTANLDNFWSTYQLAEPVSDHVKVGSDFYLAPLVPIVAREDGTIVAVVGREEGSLYRLRAGRLVEIADRTEQQPGQHDQGGWSQANYQRHIEKLVQEHLKGVAEAIERRREEAGRHGRAASGWAQTLEAASDGRVDLLLFRDGADRRAWRCPA